MPYNPPPYTFKHYCKLYGLDCDNFKKPPYTFSQWVEQNPQVTSGDFNPDIVYDGYVYSLECLGYSVYGDAIYGIGILK